MQEWLGQDKFLSALPRPPSVSHAEEEQRTITQVCEMLLYEGVEAYKVEAYKKEGPKFVQRLVAKQKVRRPGQGLIICPQEALAFGDWTGLVL